MEEVKTLPWFGGNFRLKGGGASATKQAYVVWFRAERYTALNNPFVIGPRFGNRDEPAFRGTVYQLGEGDEVMTSLSCFTSVELKINLLPT